MSRFYFLKLSLFGILLFASCGKKQEVVRYTTDGKVNTVSVGKVMKALHSVEEEYHDFLVKAVSNPEKFKTVIFHRVLEPVIATLEAKIMRSEESHAKYQKEIANLIPFIPYFYMLKINEDMYQASEKILEGKKYDVASVSVMAFYPGSEYDKTPEEILAELKSSKDKEKSFEEAATIYNNKLIGTGRSFNPRPGYLGYVISETITAAAVRSELFESGSKTKGLLEKVLSDDKGSYLVYVHKPVHKVSIRTIMQDYESDAQSIQEVIHNELRAKVIEGVKFFYDLDASKNVVFDDKIVKQEDLSDDTKVVQFLKKDYTLKDLRMSVRLTYLMSGKAKLDSTVSDLEILKDVFLQIKNANRYNNGIFESFFIVLALFDPKQAKTAEYKKFYKEVIADTEMGHIYNTINTEIGKKIDKTVSDEEIQKEFSKFYQNSNSSVKFTLENAKGLIKRNILHKRAERLMDEYRLSLYDKYSIVWNDKGFNVLVSIYKKRFEEHMKKIKAKESKENKEVSQKVES